MLLRSRPTNRCRILIYHAAGNPTTGVSCRIGHVVILAVLDYHGGAVGLNDGIGLGSIDHDRRIDQSDFERAVWRSMRVRHVAGMSWPCHDTVVRVARIEARARRVERGGSLAHGMNVNGMLTRRHSLDRELAQSPGRGLLKKTVPTSWRLVSCNTALADWAAAGTTGAVASKTVTLTACVHFRMSMPWACQ